MGDDIEFDHSEVSCDVILCRDGLHASLATVIGAGIFGKFDPVDGLVTHAARCDGGGGELVAKYYE